eukprot:SAG11_NODE_23097_length_395_cov_0.736486_1_plen_110_part_01
MSQVLDKMVRYGIAHPSVDLQLRKQKLSTRLHALLEEKEALLELKREKDAREQAEAQAAMARTRSQKKAEELAAAKAELARLKEMRAQTATLQDELEQDGVRLCCLGLPS